MDIYGNQFISDVETQEGKAQLRFMGVLQYAGKNYLSDYDKVIYSATVRDNGTQEVLGMSPAFFEVDKNGMKSRLWLMDLPILPERFSVVRTNSTW